MNNTKKIEEVIEKEMAKIEASERSSMRTDIVKKIHKLSAAKAEEVSAVLTEIKRLKGEGKSEMDREVFVKIAEFEKLLEEPNAD